MRKWIIVIVISVLLGYAVYEFVSSTSEAEGEEEPDVGLEQGNLAPDFELETMDGETVKLSDFRGEKVMLNFWASWCPPCRAEMPDIQKFHEKNDGVIVSVNLTETENSMRNVDEFVDEFDLTFDILKDEDTSVGNRYKAQALPTSYMINSKGEIHNIAVGPVNYDTLVEVFDEMD